MFSSPLPAPPAASSASAAADNAANSKRKRRPAGTPDPDAEVVSLSPRTLLESDRYVCEICNQGFQRDQNLQMHRRRHKVPWKLLKREAPPAGADPAAAARKRVFVCPEPSCLHHDPSHALGDLVGIKKHFRRKHSSHRQWACGRCSKAYAVQSDYKAHLKTCGTRGHSCDCGRVFSRVESFIEHQDACNAGTARAEINQPPQLQPPPPPCLSRTASSPSPSNDTNLSSAAAAAWAGPRISPASLFLDRRRELQLLPASPIFPASAAGAVSEAHPGAELELTIGLGTPPQPAGAPAAKLREEAREQLRLAMGERAVADEARQQARRQMELAEQELAEARRVRQQARAELGKAHAMRDQAAKKVSAAMLQITCQACKGLFMAASSDENSLAASYMSSVVTEGEAEDDDHRQQLQYQPKTPNS